MSYEVDVRAVGEESKSGDAIVLRYGDFSAGRDGYRVVVIDGGFKEDGNKLVDHIVDWYGTNSVDLVISTHPDNDHVSGLRPVLEQLDVATLWMHRPWSRARVIRDLVEGRLTAKSISRRLQASLNTATELEDIARENGTDVIEPFQGLSTSDNRLVDL